MTQELSKFQYGGKYLAASPDLELVKVFQGAQSGALWNARLFQPGITMESSFSSTLNFVSQFMGHESQVTLKENLLLLFFSLS